MHILKLLFLFFLFSNGASAQTVQPDPNLKLWYNNPALAWEEALPLGNAKTGAMVFGGIINERFQLNDNTLWSGYPKDSNNPNGPIVLPQLRQQIFKGNYDSATTLWKKMQGDYSARYLPMADLLLAMKLKDSVATKYYRDLDLNNAIATVSFITGGITYTRQTFISHPDKVMVVRLTSNKRGSINLSTSLTSKLHFTTTAVANNQLQLKGRAPKYVAHRNYDTQQIVYDEKEGMTFEVQVKIKNEGGSVRKAGTGLRVENADAITIYLTEATSFNGYNKSPGLNGKDPSAEAKYNLQNAFSKSFVQLKQTHVTDYQSLFNRVKINLGVDTNLLKLPVNKRLQQFALTPKDYQLQALYYQYGRYLLISTSRPGSQPANLQGIWNELVQPPWGSNYTTNINLQMNYWLAENTNLSECHQPLFEFIKELAVNGAKTAKINYGIDEGWVVHHNSDVWAKTSPTGGFEWDKASTPRWASWQMGAAWLSTHLWEHYLYTGDKRFLQKDAYELMKGAAQFMLHWLVIDPRSGYLVTNPSSSPENTIKMERKEYEITMASTMDMSIIRELFTDVIKASEALETDNEFRNQLIKAKDKLYPYHIGKYGQLQEWFKDWDDPKDEHRHISQLFGLYPGKQITVNSTPELAAAARQSLYQRGDESTGWSMAWKINWWARLHDGEHAFKILKAAFNFIDPTQKEIKYSSGGTYPNLFDAHPPFQIDGNFGATAGITEMLLQSHDGQISLLPALPAAWQNGYIKGIKARGNFTVDIEWKMSQLSTAKIYSAIGGNCRLRTLIPVKIIGIVSTLPNWINPNNLNIVYGTVVYEKDKQAIFTALEGEKEYVIDFMTEKGKTYLIVPFLKN